MQDNVIRPPQFRAPLVSRIDEHVRETLRPACTKGRALSRAAKEALELFKAEPALVHAREVMEERNGK